MHGTHVVLHACTAVRPSPPILLQNTVTITCLLTTCSLPEDPVANYSTCISQSKGPALHRAVTHDPTHGIVWARVTPDAFKVCYISRPFVLLYLSQPCAVLPLASCSWTGAPTSDNVCRYQIEWVSSEPLQLIIVICHRAMELPLTNHIALRLTGGNRETRIKSLARTKLES